MCAILTLFIHVLMVYAPLTYLTVFLSALLSSISWFCQFFVLKCNKYGELLRLGAGRGSFTEAGLKPKGWETIKATAIDTNIIQIRSNSYNFED